MTEWGYDLFTVAYPELRELAFQVLSMHAEVNELGIDKLKLWRYVNEVASRYHERPFHNLRHAVDVLLATSCLMRFLQRAHPEPFKDPLTVTALLLSAFVHDVDHPGVMNSFLIATSHPLAVLYNFKSVLENHHAATAVALMQRPELDFLGGLERVRRVAFIQALQGNVLATDVTTTMPAIKAFSATVSGGEVPSTEMVRSPSSKRERQGGCTARRGARDSRNGRAHSPPVTGA